MKVFAVKVYEVKKGNVALGFVCLFELMSFLLKVLLEENFN